MYCVFQHPTPNPAQRDPTGLKPISELEAKSNSGFLDSVVNSSSFACICGSLLLFWLRLRCARVASRSNIRYLLNPPNSRDKP